MAQQPCAFSPTPPLPSSLRQSVLKHARSKGWLVASNGRQVADACLAAFQAGTLPDVTLLPVGTDGSPEKRLARRLSLESDEEEEEEGQKEQKEEQQQKSKTQTQVEVVDVDALVTEFEDALRLDTEIIPQLKHSQQWLPRGDFLSQRVTASEHLMHIFDKEVINGKLLGGKEKAVTLSWSGRLRKTAGITRMRRLENGSRVAAVELSLKVVDEPARLYNTLAHELCHVAMWVVDDVAKPPHGEVFRKWARRFREWDVRLEITTCHEYEIRYKFRYMCECGVVYGRHSKSIDVNRKVCGKCGGRLRLEV